MKPADRKGQRFTAFPATVLVACLLLLPQTVIATRADAKDLTESRRIELRSLLLQDCGSCHGMTLKGGLGPALTPAALANKPKEFIQLTISEGRSGTPMPPWKNILSQNEIRWLVDLLYTGTEQDESP